MYTAEHLRYVALSNLSGFILFLESAPPMLAEWQRAHAHKLGQCFLDAYTCLIAFDKADAASGSASYKPTWHARPKCHTVWHAVQHLASSRMNVLVLFSCWVEEDFMGHMSRIYRKCHARTACRRALQRYLVHVHSELLSIAC